MEKKLNHNVQVSTRGGKSQGKFLETLEKKGKKGN